MASLRAFFRMSPRLAAMLVALALAMKALVPVGYMIGPVIDASGGAKLLTVEICADASGQRLTRQIAVPMADGHAQGQQDGTAKVKGDACPYGGLSAAGLAAADPALLALALAFILTLGFAAVSIPRLSRVPHLRPPLRGPPAFA